MRKPLIMFILCFIIVSCSPVLDEPMLTPETETLTLTPNNTSTITITPSPSSTITTTYTAIHTEIPSHPPSPTTDPTKFAEDLDLLLNVIETNGGC